MNTLSRRLSVIGVMLSLLVVMPGAHPSSAAAPALSVANPGLLADLTAQQRSILSQRGFVVLAHPPRTMGGPIQQFYDLYTNNYYREAPSFITSDVLLHTFHVMYDQTLVALEREMLAPRLAKLTDGLVSATSYQLSATKDTSVKQAAQLNLGFVAVARRLLEPGVAVPAAVAGPVKAELALIAAHRGFAASPLFGTPIDYSQFIPRGHYSSNPTMRRYFQAMMWYSRVSFHLNGSGSRLATRQALLLVRALTLVPGLRALWSAIFDPATAWVGQADDLTPLDYARVMARVYPASASVDSLADNANLTRFITLANALPNPGIIGDLVSSSAGAGQATKGMRLFPQRFTADAAITQQLIWDKVGTRQHPRIWPMGLDVAATLGSQRAVALLTGPLHQNQYAHYTQRLSTLRQYYAALPASAWRQNLYWRWLDTLRAEWANMPAGAPGFMQRTAWKDKMLAGGLGSWAELRHDTLLYVKQPLGLGAGGQRMALRTPYVEPVPAVFGRLHALIQTFKGVLAGEGLLDRLPQPVDRIQASNTYLIPSPRGESGYRAAIDSFASVVASAQRVAQRELHGQSATPADTTILAQLGFELDLLTNFFEDNAAGKVLSPDKKQVAVVGDIFTEPVSGQVLEEGVGDVLPLYAVVSINGKQWLARGGTLSYYEFHWPMSNRLTDDAWRAMTNRPPQPSWTGSYIVH